MKHLITNLILLLVITFASNEASFAQVPQGINYQAVARDTSGNTLNNQSVALRFSIHNLSSTGAVVYQETNIVNTNSLGLFSVILGLGNPIAGIFSSINWANGAKYLQTEMDVNGGANFVNMGTTQLMSVPYAMSSGDNQWTKNGNDISNNNMGSISIGNVMPDSTAKLDISSTTKGFLMPRMTRLQRLSIQQPADGLQVFQTDTLQGVYTYISNYKDWYIQTIQKDNTITGINQQVIIPYSSNIQKFAVPAGVTSIKITANGASGGIGSDLKYVIGGQMTEFHGTPGKRIQGTLNVASGDTIVISTGNFANTSLIGPFPDGNSGSQATWVEAYTYSYGCGLGATCYGTDYINHLSSSGASGGSTRIFMNDTNMNHLMIKSSGGDGGTDGHSTPGYGVPHSISSSVQNAVISVDSTWNQKGWVMIEYSIPSYIVSNTGNSSGGGSNAVANQTTTGLLASTDWNTFSNKVDGIGVANEIAFFNGSKSLVSSPSLKWDNSNARLDVVNIKVGSLSGGSGIQLVGVDSTGKLTSTTFSPTGDNLGNHIATQTLNLNNNFISNNGSRNGIRIDNNGYVGIDLDSTVTSFSVPFNVNSLNNGTGAANWIASSVGGKAGGRVVSGTLNGMATIGAHDYSLSSWTDLRISPTGNVAIGNILPATKLDIDGTLRATNIGIGTASPQRALDVRGDIAQGSWTDNIPNRRIGVMNNLLQVAGMEIENTTLGGNYSQKLHLLTHHYGNSTDRRLTIDEDGKVGIGTTSPTEKLTVIGNANVSGTLSSASFTSGNVSVTGAFSATSITSSNATISNTMTAGNIVVPTGGTVTTSAINTDHLNANDIVISPGGSLTATNMYGTNVNVSNVTAGNIATLPTGSVTTNTIVSPNITSSKFKVTEIWNNIQGVPATTNFTSGGGTLMLNISAMAYQNSGGPVALTIHVMIDGLFVTDLKGFATELASQKTLSANFKVLTGLAAGTHTIQLVPLSPTIMDSNSFTSASILELPF